MGWFDFIAFYVFDNNVGQKLEHIVPAGFKNNNEFLLTQLSYLAFPDSNTALENSVITDKSTGRKVNTHSSVYSISVPLSSDLANGEWVNCSVVYYSKPNRKVERNFEQFSLVFGTRGNFTGLTEYIAVKSSSVVYNKGVDAIAKIYSHIFEEFPPLDNLRIHPKVMILNYFNVHLKLLVLGRDQPYPRFIELDPRTGRRQPANEQFVGCFRHKGGIRGADLNVPRVFGLSDPKRNLIAYLPLLWTLLVEGSKVVIYSDLNVSRLTSTIDTVASLIAPIKFPHGRIIPLISIQNKYLRDVLDKPFSILGISNPFLLEKKVPSSGVEVVTLSMRSVRGFENIYPKFRRTKRARKKAAKVFPDYKKKVIKPIKKALNKSLLGVVPPINVKSSVRTSSSSAEKEIRVLDADSLIRNYFLSKTEELLDPIKRYVSRRYFADNYVPSVVLRLTGKRDKVATLLRNIDLEVLLANYVPDGCTVSPRTISLFIRTLMFREWAAGYFFDMEKRELEEFLADKEKVSKNLDVLGKIPVDSLSPYLSRNRYSELAELLSKEERRE